MAGITLEQSEGQLTDWLAASSAVAKNQSYSIAGRSLTRADASEILRQVEFWDRQVKRLSNPTRRRVRYGVPE